MQEKHEEISNFYIANLMLIAAIFLSIISMFAVQFKVEALQDEIAKTESEIVDYHDKIQLLEVEWVYLTRPERLRVLASHYLQNNGYALASQITNVDSLERYYLASYQKVEEQNQGNQLALEDQNQGVKQVSF